MHVRQRIVLCRIGFIAFGIFPTLVVCGWLASLSAGGMLRATKEEWASELSRRTGLRVAIAAVSYPESGLAHLEQVSCRDPETGQLIVQAESIGVSTTADTFQLEIVQLVIQTEQAAAIRGVLENRLLRSSFDGLGEKSSGTVRAKDVVLRAGGDSQTFHDLHCAVTADSTAVEIKWHGTLPHEGSELRPVMLSLRRDRTRSPPETAWELNTGGNVLPCRLAAAFAPQVEYLGRECQFAGTIRVVDLPSGPAGTLQGQLSNVDLDALVTEQFSHQLSGQANVDISSAVVSEGKLIELAGTLRARGGTISPSLLTSMQVHLGLVLFSEAPLDESTRPVSFRELAIAFRLDGRSLRLAGLHAPAKTGVLLFGAEGPLVGAPPHHAIAAVQLVRALVPDNQYQVPATRQTDVLVSVLPVPDFAPARSAALPTHIPTRLGSSGPADAAPVLHEPGLR